MGPAVRGPYVQDYIMGPVDPDPHANESSQNNWLYSVFAQKH